MSLTFVGLNPATEAVNGVINLTALGANAEITAFNSKTGYGYTVGGGSGAIIVLDLRDPSKAKAVAKAAPTVTGQTLQSAAVFGNLLAVAVPQYRSLSAGMQISMTGKLDTVRY